MSRSNAGVVSLEKSWVYAFLNLYLVRKKHGKVTIRLLYKKYRQSLLARGYKTRLSIQGFGMALPKCTPFDKRRIRLDGKVVRGVYGVALKCV